MVRRFRCHELATRYREARNAKPIHAVSNHFCASAALMLASGATTLSVSPSGQIGSIGTYTYHVDVSQAERTGMQDDLSLCGEIQGRDKHVRSLGDEAKAEMQRVVDWYYSQFVEAVAAGRGAAPRCSTIFGQGRMLVADQAKSVGLVDRVATSMNADQSRAPSAIRRQPSAIAATRQA